MLFFVVFAVVFFVVVFPVFAEAVFAEVVLAEADLVAVFAVADLADVFAVDFAFVAVLLRETLPFAAVVGVSFIFSRQNSRVRASFSIFFGSL